MARRVTSVAVVDDSPFARRALARVLMRNADLQVVGEAGDGAQALALLEKTPCDVVLLDLGMPVMDGLSTLREIKSRHPNTEVVVVSAATTQGAEATIDALEEGAFDFVHKGSVQMSLHDLAEEIVAKVRAASTRRTGPKLAAQWPHETFSALEVLVVGASTGGPPALLRFLARLPFEFPAPVVVVQHIPSSFVEPLAERVGEVAALKTRVLTGPEPIRRGTIYFPAGGKNVEPARSEAGLVLVRKPAAPSTPHVPSVDALFEGAARVCGERAWGVLLTGMGRDGAQGLLKIRHAGGLTVAQDEATSAVWGMPRAACELGAAAAVLGLDQIASFLLEAASKTCAPELSSGPMGGF